MGNTVTIDGVTYEGNSVEIGEYGELTIDNKVVAGVRLPRVVKVVVTGTLNTLISHASVECGEVTGSVSAGGSVKCGNVGAGVRGSTVTCKDVTGDVDATGSVECGNVGAGVKGSSITCKDVTGDVKASGSITAGNISGSAKASGSISYRR